MKSKPMRPICEPVFVRRVTSPPKPPGDSARPIGIGQGAPRTVGTGEQGTLRFPSAALLRRRRA